MEVSGRILGPDLGVPGPDFGADSGGCQVVLTPEAKAGNGDQCFGDVSAQLSPPASTSGVLLA